MITAATVFALAHVVLPIVLAANLSCLGLSAGPPAPEWGAMITEERTFSATAW